MESEYIGMVKAPLQGEYINVGTGFAIGENLLVTARHVVFDNERIGNRVSIHWPKLLDENSNPLEVFIDVNRDIEFDGHLGGGHKLDIVIFRCALPKVINENFGLVQEHSWKSGDKWESYGFPYLRYKVAPESTNSIPVMGEMFGYQKSSHIIHLSNTTRAAVSKDWGGLSGAPIILPDTDSVAGILTQVPTAVDNQFIGVSFPWILKNKKDFEKALNSQSSEALRTGIDDSNYRKDNEPRSQDKWFYFLDRDQLTLKTEELAEQYDFFTVVVSGDNNHWHEALGKRLLYRSINNEPNENLHVFIDGSEHSGRGLKNYLLSETLKKFTLSICQGNEWKTELQSFLKNTFSDNNSRAVIQYKLESRSVSSSLCTELVNLVLDFKWVSNQIENGEIVVVLSLFEEEKKVAARLAKFFGIKGVKSNLERKMKDASIKSVAYNPEKINVKHVLNWGKSLAEFGLQDCDVKTIQNKCISYITGNQIKTVDEIENDPLDKNKVDNKGVHTSHVKESFQCYLGQLQGELMAMKAIKRIGGNNPSTANPGVENN